jgi:hypothetical protein
LSSLFNILNVSIFFEVRFLTVVRSAFCAVNSDDFTANQVSIFKKRNKEFEQFFNPNGFCSKVGYTMVVGYDGA